LIAPPGVTEPSAGRVITLAAPKRTSTSGVNSNTMFSEGSTSSYSLPAVTSNTCEPEGV
jgi:hypothetical protein